MNTTSLKTRWSFKDLPLPDHHGLGIAIPSQFLDRMGQVHYFLDFGSSQRIRLEIELDDIISALPPEQNEHNGHFPLQISGRELWYRFCIGPHSDSLLSERCFLVGQRALNRFIKVDIETKTARLLDPGVEDEFLSCTNWVDPSTKDLWFASWRFDDTMRRMSNPSVPVRVRIWKHRSSEHRIHKIWEGQGGDFLHQISLSGDRRFLVLCEMGMRLSADVPAGHPGQFPAEWRLFQEKGVLPSEILVLDLERGREWRLPSPVSTPAHVEWDTRRPYRVYISCHNLGLVGGVNTLFGPGVILCYELHPDGPRQKGIFTAKDFYRITTHHIFEHRGRTLIGVTGFPDTVFLIDAEKMMLHKKIRLFHGEEISTEFRPHFCQPDPRSPYSLIASEDGKTLYIVGSGILFVVDVDTGLLKTSPWEFYQESDNETITGHLTVYES